VNKYSEKVSIVLPVYNGSRYLRQAIESCLKQTYKNIELIIVDDGSTDETPEIIQSYKDQRINYIKHKENQGVPHALNTGFYHATGEYLTWTSDDNLYDKKAIEKMLSFLKNKNLEFVYCDYYWFEDDNLQNLRLTKLPDKPIMEKQNDVGACFLYSKKVKEVVGDFNPDFILAEDYEYWIRVSQKFSMGHLNKPLYFYRTHPAALARSKYYDVRIINALVRLNHNLINVDQAVNYLNLVATEKFWGIQRINKYIIGIFFSKKIRKVLMDFQAGSLSLVETKLALRNILKGGRNIPERHGNK
jgi:glycosyltransferase involved in cell wall biosynthesis